MQKPKLRTPISPARQGAVFLINGVIVGKKMLSDLTSHPKILELSPADRAAAQRLALTTLRNFARALQVLKPHLAKPPHVTVQSILALGVVERAVFDAPAHGIINDLVSICGQQPKTRGLKGLVNAVLRKALNGDLSKWGTLAVPMLPKWLRGPLIEAYGNSAIQGMERAHLQGAPLDLSGPADAFEGIEGSLMPNGAFRVVGTPQVSALPGYAEGRWWVQDAAAQFPVAWLDPKPEERILDLCAAPGGKTLQLAKAGAKVTALDVSEARMARIQENLDRCGLPAELVQQDLLTYDGSGFDAVLLDAPCSATGTLRRHPDLPFAKDGAGVSELISLQAKMLQAAAQMVKPGGRLIYCTCSLIPDEGEVQVEEFLAQNSDFKINKDLPAGALPSWTSEEGGLRLRPDFWLEDGGMDGFYIARLDRAAT